MKKKIIILACILAAVLGVSALVIFKIPAKPKYTAGNAEITDRIESIRIDCDNGKFTVLSTDKNKIEVKEVTAASSKKSDPTLNWAVTGKTLRILCNSKKDSEYILTVPASNVIDDLDIEGKSVSADVSDITARDFTLRSDEGIVSLQRCKCIDSFIGEYNSGNVSFYNTFARRFDIKSGSADIHMVSPTFQRKCNISTKSGNIDITAPKDSKFCINEYHGKGSFNSDFKSDKTGGVLNLKTSSGRIALTNSGNIGKEIAAEANVTPPEVSTQTPKPTVRVPATTVIPDDKKNKKDAEESKKSVSSQTDSNSAEASTTVKVKPDNKDKAQSTSAITEAASKEEKVSPEKTTVKKTAAVSTTAKSES